MVQAKSRASMKAQQAAQLSKDLVGTNHKNILGLSDLKSKGLMVKQGYRSFNIALPGRIVSTSQLQKCPQTLVHWAKLADSPDILGESSPESALWEWNSSRSLFFSSRCQQMSPLHHTQTQGLERFNDSQKYDLK